MFPPINGTRMLTIKNLTTSHPGSEWKLYGKMGPRVKIIRGCNFCELPIIPFWNFYSGPRENYETGRSTPKKYPALSGTHTGMAIISATRNPICYITLQTLQTRLVFIVITSAKWVHLTVVLYYNVTTFEVIKQVRSFCSASDGSSEAADLSSRSYSHIFHTKQFRIKLHLHTAWFLGSVKLQRLST